MVLSASSMEIMLNSSYTFYVHLFLCNCIEVTRLTIKSFCFVTGALGGLAFAMVVVGGAFGTVGGYFLFGRRGPQSGIVTFQEMMKQ